MKNNLGVFLNNTKSETNYNINIHNFNILKNNFDNIIILDCDNKLSQKFKNLIYKKNNSKIIKYIINNKYIKDNLNDFDIENIIYALNNINDLYKDEYKFITFINDNYIYCDNLKNYFNYVNIHNLNFCSYTDSTENNYHYQLYLFTVMSSYINKLITNIQQNNTNILSIFDNKMPFVKVAYLNDNINCNIFYNNKLYIELIKNKMLPILNINILYYTIENNIILNKYIRDILHNYKLLDNFGIPHNFNILKYKEYNNDLINLEESELMDHWFRYGRNENRQYC
jgi:hypothetical protein